MNLTFVIIIFVCFLFLTYVSNASVLYCHILHVLHHFGLVTSFTSLLSCSIFCVVFFLLHHVPLYLFCLVTSLSCFCLVMSFMSFFWGHFVLLHILCNFYLIMSFDLFVVAMSLTSFFVLLHL